MIVGVAHALDAYLLEAQVALGRASSLIAPAHQDFDEACRAEAVEFVREAANALRSAREEVSPIIRHPHVLPATAPHACAGCKRLFVERTALFDRCTVCGVLPGWSAKPELCELIHPGLEAQEPK